MTACIVCGGSITGSGIMLCSDPCRKIRERQVRAQWEADHREHRRAYFRRRYWRNPEHYRAKALASYHRNPNRNREPDPLVRKVMKEWRTGVKKARAWIEAGSFPP